MNWHTQDDGNDERESTRAGKLIRGKTVKRRTHEHVLKAIQAHKSEMKTEQ